MGEPSGRCAELNSLGQSPIAVYTASLTSRSSNDAASVDRVLAYNNELEVQQQE